MGRPKRKAASKVVFDDFDDDDDDDFVDVVDEEDEAYSVGGGDDDDDEDEKPKKSRKKSDTPVVLPKAKPKKRQPSSKQKKAPKKKKKTGLVAQLEADRIVFTGKTFELKDDLKSLGGKWNADERVWTLKRDLLTPTVQASLQKLGFDFPDEDEKEAPKKKTKTKKTSSSSSSSRLLISETTRAQIEDAEEEFSTWTVAQLKELLFRNEQKRSGSKNILIERCAEGSILGRIPRCPSCGGGRPDFNLNTELYKCKGYFDDEDFQYCNKTYGFEDLNRLPWQGHE